MKHFMIFAATAALTAVIFAQASFNIDLLAQKNEHRFGGVGPDTSYHYSSVWGYTHPNGREYAIIGYWNGTAIYDITNAPTVVQCDTVPGPTSYYNYREFAVIGNYLYIVSEGTGGGQAGVQIVNLSYLPDSVRHISNWTNASINRSHTIKSYGNYLYLNGSSTNSGGIVILDATNPTSLVQLGSGPAVYSHDCFILNDTVYTSNIYNTSNCMTIINATNKNAPTLVTTFTYPDPGLHNVWTTPDRKWLVTTDEINVGRHARLWNIQNLNNITFVYEYIPYQTATVHNGYFKDYLLFLAHYKAGVVVLDCANLPAAPTVKGYYDTYFGTANTGYHGAWNVYPYYNSGKFVVSDMQTGLWVFKFSNINGIWPNGAGIPSDYKLGQNYPNPFNPMTKINFDIPKAGNISLKVYDASGKLVETIYEGFQLAGKYTADFNASKISSGVYFYWIKADGFVQTKKMVVAK
ncbi:MAG TPA: choice-of-anchor B family protein [Ignavibacteria bacterium]